MEFPGYALRTADEHLDNIRRAAEEASRRVWPEFLLHCAVANAHWGQLWTRFPGYQYALVDDETGRIVAAREVPCEKRRDELGLPASRDPGSRASGLGGTDPAGPNEPPGPLDPEARDDAEDRTTAPQ